MIAIVCLADMLTGTHQIAGVFFFFALMIQVQPTPQCANFNCVYNHDNDKHTLLMYSQCHCGMHSSSHDVTAHRLPCVCLPIACRQAWERASIEAAPSTTPKTQLLAKTQSWCASSSTRMCEQLCAAIAVERSFTHSLHVTRRTSFFIFCVAPCG